VPLLPAIPQGLSPVDTSTPVGGTAKNVYRPAAVLRLTIRLEDFSNDDGPQAQSEGRPAKTASARAIAGAASLRSLQAVRRASGEVDPALDAQVTVANKKAARFASGKTAATGAAPPGGSGLDEHAIRISVVPLDLTCNLNGFRTADKVEFQANLLDLPIPPDLVRSMLVEVFMNTVHVDDFADPARWVPKVSQTPPMFRGYAEEEALEVDEGKASVTVSALSLEQRLMSLKINPFTKERRIAKAGEPVTAYIQRLISTIPEFNGTFGDAMGVRMFPNVAADKIPRLDAKLFKRSLQSASSRAQAGGQVQGAPPPGTDPSADPSNGQPAGVGFPTPSPVVADVSVWDIITRAAELAGTIPVYDPSIVAREPDGTVSPLGANNILLIPPQNIKETPQDGITIPGGPVDGFERSLTLGGTSTIRTQVRFLVWGSNLREMKIARKYGREKAPRVRCICHNPDAPAGKRVLTSVFPTTLRGTSVSAVGSGSAKGHAPVEEEVVRVIREIRRQDELDRIAEALYHAIGRREVTCLIETNELASYVDPTRPETQNENPDLLTLRPGTPCRVVVARRVQDPASPDFVVNGLSELMDRRANPAFLRQALSSNPAVAGSPGARALIEKQLAKLEAAFQSSRLTDWFYTRNLTVRWNPNDGWSASIELSNYVEARNSPANLSKQDRQRNDTMKAIKPGATKPDARGAAIEANLDSLLTKSGGGQ
jgi:hypothetical protein